MMKRRRIGIDLDETAVDFCTPYLNLWNQLHTTQFTREDLTTFDFWRALGGTPEEHYELSTKFLSNKKNNPLIKPLPGAQEVIRFLSWDNDLYVVTARPVRTTDATLELVDLHFPRLFKDVALVDTFFPREMSGGSRKKVEICKTLNLGALVDDKLQTILELQGTNVKGILFGDYAWNRTATPYPNRAEDWEKTLKRLKHKA